LWALRPPGTHRAWPPKINQSDETNALFIYVDALPRNLQATVLWLPMVHCTEMIRDGYFGSVFTARYSVGYLAGCNLVMSALGLALERKVSREFVPE